MKSRLLGALCAPCLLFVSNITCAALVERDLFLSGDGLLTYDSITGYEWLDLTETKGLSYNYVAGQLGVGGAYEGFNIGSSTDIVSLFTSGGWTGALNTNHFNDQARANEALGLINLLGDTFMYDDGNGVTVNASHGYASDTDGTGYLHYDDSIALEQNIGFFYSRAWINGPAYDPNGTTGNQTNIGTWLYRPSAVPIPSALYLFGFALIGLMGAARKCRTV